MPLTTDHDQFPQPSLAPPPVSDRAESVGAAAVPLPPGLQTITLTPAEAQAIRQLLDDETRPAHEGKEMPMADASVLRRRS